MTNEEKYLEVFGMPADISNCPTVDCSMCPCELKNSLGESSCIGASTYEWWRKEYKEGGSK